MVVNYILHKDKCELLLANLIHYLLLLCWLLHHYICKDRIRNCLGLAASLDLGLDSGLET